MNDELQSLGKLFNERLFRIPDYQRGYAWRQDQLVDFWEDLVNLQPDRCHYTGLISLKPLENEKDIDLGDDSWIIENGYRPYHVVDGQQRITTFVILLNEIVSFVRKLNENENRPDDQITIGYEKVNNIVEKYIFQKRGPNQTITTYIFDYEKDDPSEKYLRYKIFDERDDVSLVETYYTKNLKFAKDFFATNIDKFYEDFGNDGLKTLYKKLTQNFMFNLHEIGNDYDVFLIFETMNNRGKKLTNLELLKNRLIYLTTIYDDNEYDEKDKSALRNKINEAWKVIYYQLGKNEESLLSDDEFLRAHWIIYFEYKRNRSNAYIKFLMEDKFVAKNIYEKTPVMIEQKTKQIISDDDLADDGEDFADIDEPETSEISKLQPKEIEDYVNSLKGMAKYWYDTYFPSESRNLNKDEKKRIDRLNRIGIGYFRPLVTAIISRSDVPSESRVKIFDAIERFIFVKFRMGNFNASRGNSEYYRAAHQVYNKEKDIDELCGEIYEKTTDEADYCVNIFANKIEKNFSNGDGYYGWSSGLKYFLYEYENDLEEKNNIDRFCAWSMFTKYEKAKVSIEHILPQTRTDDWNNKFEQFSEAEINMLSGALGNLLPLSQSINSALQNDSFEDKKHSKEGRRGYENGSHSEIEVSKVDDWNALEIYKRTIKLLNFMQERWDIHFNEEQLDKLIGISFVKERLENPEESI